MSALVAGPPRRFERRSLAAGGSTVATVRAVATPVHITFSASGGGEYGTSSAFSPTSGRECYARKPEDQTCRWLWTLGWNAAIVERRPLPAARGRPRIEGEIAGSTTGTSVRDGCDEPDEADPLWVGSDRCDGPYRW